MWVCACVYVEPVGGGGDIARTPAPIKNTTAFIPGHGREGGKEGGIEGGRVEGGKEGRRIEGGKEGG